MTDNTAQSAQDVLKQRLADLDIRVAVSDEGVHTVYTTCEPLFCFDSYDKDELPSLVVDTLESYARNFFATDLKIGIVSKPSPRPLPVEHVTVLSRLEPVFDLAA